MNVTSEKVYNNPELNEIKGSIEKTRVEHERKNG